MAKRGLARLDELTDVARSHGWASAREAMVGVDLPEDTEAAEGWMAQRTLDDGRIAYWMVVYGKPVGRQWQVLRVDGKWGAICRIEEPTCYDGMNVDYERFFENINQCEHWLAHFGDVLARWRNDEVTPLPERKTMTERIREAVSKDTT